jgi:ribosomal protein S18 acetylase RimI-like enzyme
MVIKISFSEDPAWVLSEAKAFLSSEPVLHNLILTLLHARVAHPEPGRYWVAKDGDKVVGVVFQSPLNYPAILTPMGSEIVSSMVDAISDTAVVLPGVSGTAATAASFAGQWTERHKSAAYPVQGLRIYEKIEVGKQAPVSGRFRQARPDDRALLIVWIRQFRADVGEGGTDPASIIDRKLPAGQIWLWDDGQSVSMAMHSDPVQNVIRIQAVYTPSERRNHGYAGVCVDELTKQLLDSGYRCILYTDLSNPHSNSIYRRIGYRAIAEALRYRFE